MTEIGIREMRLLVQVTERINEGVGLIEVLDHVYDSFHALVPYNRMGFSLIEGAEVRAHWARSDAVQIKLGVGYSAPLTGSLLQVMESRQPRILNDLEAYLREHPGSHSTALMLAEGVRSSLTCPLIAAAAPVGFLFFSSTQANAYRPEHIELLREIAGQVALIVEKSRLHGELVALNAEKNALLGTAAHDLRSPLAVVQGFTELLQDSVAGPVTEKQREVLAIMRRTCQNMLRLIDNFLDVSAIESGRLELQPRQVELLPLLGEAATLNGMLAQSKKIRLDLELDPEIGSAVLDPDRINQVLSNLLGNAIKFSHPGTSVTLSARGLADEVELQVRDRGPGIPADELPKLFHRYGRGSVRPTAGERSSGLGLVIVRRMVEAHGGTVGVRSKVGEGSTFTVRLPREARTRRAADPQKTLTRIS
jgi:signal transduction histidine kinase